MLSQYKEKIISIINKYSNKKNDTGCSEVQIAILNFRINNLNIHFKKHKKDFHSKRGLMNMINKRKNLLLYLKKKNNKKYNILIEKLKLRK